MGRVRGEVPRGKFRLRVVGKPLPEKFYQVNIEYTWNATIIRKATDVKSRIADWNPKGNLGVASYDHRMVGNTNALMLC